MSENDTPREELTKLIKFYNKKLNKILENNCKKGENAKKNLEYLINSNEKLRKLKNKLIDIRINHNYFGAEKNN